MNQWVEGEERPSVRRECGFCLPPPNELHVDRDGFSAQGPYRRVTGQGRGVLGYAGVDNEWPVAVVATRSAIQGLKQQ